jgi:hypothetical protein
MILVIHRIMIVAESSYVINHILWLTSEVVRTSKVDQHQRHVVNIRHRGTLRTPLALRDNNAIDDVACYEGSNRPVGTSLALFTETVLSTLCGCGIAALLMYPIERYHLQWQNRTLKEWTNDYRPRENHPYRKFISPISRLLFQEVSLNITESWTRSSYSLVQHKESNVSFPALYPYHCFVNTPLRQEITAGALSGIAQALLLCPLAAWQH